MKRHREWLDGLRLVDRAEWIALAVAGAHLLVCLAVLAFTKFPAIVLIEIAAVHLVFMTAGVLKAQRSLSIGVQGATALSLMFTLVYALTDPSTFGDINHGYNVLGFLALLMAVWGLVTHGAGWRGIGKYREQDDFKWLVTRAPMSLRFMVAWELKRLEPHDE